MPPLLRWRRIMGNNEPRAWGLRESLLLAAVGAALLGGCDWMKKKDPPAAKSKAELASEQRERIRKACASDATYGRLKELIFDEAARIRNSDPRNLDPLAAAAVVRMEAPVVKSRDDELNVTVCSGRFILELPPGAENAFDGKRRLEADVEYAAQAAVDGSGLVYQMDGAEPIIYRLATFGLNGPPPKIAPAPPVPAPNPPPVVIPTYPPGSQPAAKPDPPAPAVEAAFPTRVIVRPSFNCRHAKTGTEKLICASPRLAAQDRQMASLWYDLMAGADPATRGHLRRSRDAFLARREQCRSEACVSSAYASRMAELRTLARGE